MSTSFCIAQDRTRLRWESVELSLVVYFYSTLARKSLRVWARIRSLMPIAAVNHFRLSLKICSQPACSCGLECLDCVVMVLNTTLSLVASVAHQSIECQSVSLSVFVSLATRVACYKKPINVRNKLYSSLMCEKFAIPNACLTKLGSMEL